MGIPVKEAARQQDHAVLQQGAFSLAGCLHFGEGFPPQFDLVFVDPLIHGEPGLIAGMVGQFVDAPADAIQSGEAHIGKVVVHHEGGNPGAVHLESQHQDVEHEAEMLFGQCRDAGAGPGDGGSLHGGSPSLSPGFCFAELLRLGNPLFQVPHRAEILIQFLAIPVTQLGAQTFGVIHDQIEDALVTDPFAAIVEQLIESLLGENFLGSGGGRAAPGEVGRVDRGEAGVGAVTRTLRAHHHAGDRRELTGMSGNDLVHGDPDFDIGRGLFHLQPGKDIHLGIMPAFPLNRGRIPKAFEHGDLLF